MANTTIKNREIKATANHIKRTFTIRVNGAKYRTMRMSKEDFYSSIRMTANDWQQYLNGCDDYYIVK